MKRFLLLILALAACFATISAREVYTLNNDWRFFFQEENSSDEARHVRLPHTWHNDPLAPTTGLYRTTGNYRRSLYVPAEWRGRRLFLRFRGVQSVADVFVNGSHVGEHRGGRTAFAFEITECINFGSDNTLLVSVSNACHNDVLPTSTEENLYGGIYRDVELIVTHQTTISPLYYGTEGVIVRPKSISTERVEGDITIALLGKKERETSLSIDIVSPDGYVATTQNIKTKIDGKTITVPFTLNTPELWSPHSPKLYRVRVATGGDTVSVTTGWRNIEVTPEHLLRVNGRRVYVHGVALNHDCAHSAAALTETHYADALRSIRGMGANAVRSLAGPHAQTLYDECDRRGMLVWVDSPLAQSPFLSDIAFYDTPRFKANGEEQLREIILQNCHHPSIAMWGIFSLMRGRSKSLLDYIGSLNKLAKSLDPSRPTVACSNQDGDINFITDLIVWHQNMGWESGSIDDLNIWQQALLDNWKHLSQAICYGEGGNLGLAGENHTRRNYSQHRLPESWQTRFHEGYAARVDETLFWGIWLNTMFDFGSSRYRTGLRNTGLMTHDHTQRKDAYYLYKTLWHDRRPTLHIVGKSAPIRSRNRQAVRIYSSQGAPTVLVNGDTVAVRQRSIGVFVTDSLTLSGRNHIEAHTADCRDSMTLVIGNYLRRH